MPHLELRNVEKKYSNDTEAVRGITFAAEKGEFIVMVGPSGCGKSTTLRMVAGLEEVTGGEIIINGKKVNDLHPKDRDIAMVFQNYALYPHLTVYENIAFPLSIRKTKKDVIETEVRKTADLLSLTKLLDRKPKELSGGERQRVALGRAIVRKPQVFLFDEPLSNLDAALRSEMRAELKDLQRRLGITMLYVTHDQTEAMTMGDRIAVLNKGQLEQFDTPANIYRRPATAFVGRFIGSPSMNMIAGSIDSDKVFVSGEFRIAIPQYLGMEKKDVVLGIRPESFSVGLTGSGHQVISGELVLVEPLGTMTNYYLSSPLSSTGSLVASVKGFDSIQNSNVGMKLSFEIEASDIHLFDSATGLRFV